MRRFVTSAYQSIYSHLPQQAKVIASELVFKLGNKPFVYHDINRHPAGRLERGVVTFSVDFEMAWAWQYARNLKEDYVTIGLREREQVPKILTKFEEHAIPATWATVGHLFLEKCGRRHDGLAHPEMQRLPHFENQYWRFTSGDWYQHDPCTDVTRDPAWYAPDLLEKVLLAKVKQEIACHGFSHAGFGSYCPQSVASSEVDACVDAMKAFGVRPVSMVFPGNDEGNFEIIGAKGFTVVRAFPVSWAEITLPIKLDDGMWRVHDSTAIDLEGDQWNISERLARLKKYINKATTERMAAHIWFHPSLNPIQMQELLFPLLRYCAEQRDKGLIDILTMEHLVDATRTALAKEGRS